LGAGRRLLALACDLVWATAWIHDANEVIAPLLGLKHVAPVRVNGTNEMGAKPFSAAVLCTGRRDGEIVCCCERRAPSRSASATIAGSAVRRWPRARLESREMGSFSSCLTMAG